MKRSFYFGFLLLLSIDTFNQVAFKLAGERARPVTLDVPWVLRILSEPWSYTIIIGYCAAFLTYMMLIKRAPVGVVFAASHLEIVTVLVVSLVLFKETQTLIQWAGCAAIIGGVVILGLTETQGES
jgi:multidrug transporter EmrE-like cation transporter